MSPFWGIESETKNASYIRSNKSRCRKHSKMDQQLPTRRGPLVRGNNHRWQLEPDVFWRNYTPIGRPERTHLLYEIRWGRSRRYWRNWCTSNRTHHAEINFLENACEEIDRRTTTPCTVTWFLTWSPCGKCSGRIKQFLQEHPNVTLKICAAQLYKQNYRFNQKGLRDLANFGVRIYIMQLADYLYCWITFVAHQRNEDYIPSLWDFLPSIEFYSQELDSILRPF
uniref:C->U-editing enzyme APOBEC-1-like n=1 Tax=Podarcis muralis TaxID=64176 RepID=UPI00109FA21C|nr:C->U-editing enzyme APOBEC-1-like [Podarcis muralis]